MNSSDNIRSRLMNSTVNHKPSSINSMHISAFNNFAFFIDENEIGNFQVSERFEDRVDPEMIGFDRIPDRDVTSTTFVAVSLHTHPAERLLSVQSRRRLYRRHVFFAVLPFFLEGGKSRAGL